VSQHEAWFELIRTSNEADAEEMFRRLRYSPTAKNPQGSNNKTSYQPRVGQDPHGADHIRDEVSHRSHQDLYDLHQSYSAIRTSPTSASTVSDASTKLSSVSPITSYTLPAGQPPTLYGGRPYELPQQKTVERSAHTTNPSPATMRAPPPQPDRHYDSGNRLPPLGNMLSTSRPAKRHEQVHTAELMEPVPVWHEETVQAYHRPVQY